MRLEELAINGGAAVRREWLPYGRQDVNDEDISAVTSVLKGDMITQGPRVAEFESAVAEECGAKYGIAFSNGTAALHAACLAAGLGASSEAVTTPLTFAASANAIVYCGARPVFADISRETLNIDSVSIERLLTPRTKAILPVDFAGLPVDLDKILNIAKKNALVVIEDACHSFGAVYKRKKVGSVSHMTVFSFHPVKHITTGEGGMVVTDSSVYAEKLRRLRHHGITQPDKDRPWAYEISELGYNYRLSDIHCALGLSQLKRIRKWVERRREIASAYAECFASMKGIGLPKVPSGHEHAWHIFVALLDLNSLTTDRDGIISALRCENIGAALHYPPVHLHPFYKRTFGCGEGLCPIAEDIAKKLITLPLFPSMTDGDVKDVVAAVRKVLGHYGK